MTAQPPAEPQNIVLRDGEEPAPLAGSGSSGVVQTFLGSTVTKVLLMVLAGQLLKDLVPMLQAHAIDFWALAEGQAVVLAALVGNGLRPDVRTPGLNWFGPKRSA